MSAPLPSEGIFRKLDTVGVFCVVVIDFRQFGHFTFFFAQSRESSELRTCFVIITLFKMIVLFVRCFQYIFSIIHVSIYVFPSGPLFDVPKRVMHALSFKTGPKHLDTGIRRKIIVHPNLMSVTMKKIATTKTVAVSRKKSWLMGSSCTTSSPSLGRHAQSLHRSRRMVDLVAVELARCDEVLCQLCQTLDKVVLLASW